MYLLIRGWFRWSKDQYKRLSARQRAVIFVSVVVPLAVHLLAMEFWPSLVTIAYIAFGLIVAPILSSAMNEDRDTTERLVGEKVDHLSEELSRLRKDLQYADEDLRLQVDDLEEFIRNGLAENNIALRPRPVIRRGRGTAIEAHFSLGDGTGVSVTRNRSLKARLRRWMWNVCGLVWKVVYGRRSHTG